MIKNKKIIIGIVCILAVGCIAFILYLNYKNGDYKVADDEIALYIQLDTREDIGLIVWDYSAGGAKHSGGISNAGKSLLKHDELIITPMKKQYELDDLADIEDFTMKFTIITEYVDPNYDNIYPEEYTQRIETPISINAHYGEAYTIRIAGDKTSGYQAALEE